MTFLLLLLIPLVIALFSFILGQGKITFKEFLVQLFAQIAIAGVSVIVIYNLNTVDVEIWNGRVTNKEREKVSCSHSYPCNCRQECDTSCDDDGCETDCDTVCDTCYKHSYDIDWNVYTNLGEIFRISRIDEQGLQEPPRWTRAYVGEPVAVRRLFENYIKGSPDTLFKYQGLLDKYQKFIPQYPDNIYDYHYLKRFIQIGLGFVEEDWNRDLMNLNAELGIVKKSNIIVVMTRDLDREFSYALQQHWLGGKKNDIIVIISLKPDFTFNWVDVVAWSESDMFQIKLRDDLLDLNVLDRSAIIEIIRKNVERHFVKKSFEEFKYLKSRITPSYSQLMFSMVLGILASLGISYCFYKDRIC